MVIELIGYKKIDYTNKQGKAVKGCTVYGIVLDCDDKTVTGKPMFEQYISELNPDSLYLNEQYRIVYDVKIFNGKPMARVSGLEIVQ